MEEVCTRAKPTCRVQALTSMGGQRCVATSATCRGFSGRGGLPQGAIMSLGIECYGKFLVLIEEVSLPA